MKTLNKIILILFFIICCEVISPRNIVNCVHTKGTDSSDSGLPSSVIETDVNQFKVNVNQGFENAEGLMPIIGKILGFLQVTSGLLAVVIIAVTGVNYVVFTPSDMRGEMKHKMLPLVLGVVLVFGAVSIAKFVVSAFS